MNLERIEQIEQTLRKWSQTQGFPNMPPSVQTMTNMCEAILVIAEDIKHQYPVISEELKGLRQT